MCLQSDCLCPRYIPQEDPPPGPRLCRDCLHWESLHAAPEPAAPKTASGMAEVLARVKARMDKSLPSSAVSEDEARRETNAGFKKVSEEHRGRGGSTKYQKKGKSTASEKTYAVAEIVLIPDGYFLIFSKGDPDASDTADDIQEIGVGQVPSVPKKQQLKDGGLVVSSDSRPGKRGGPLEYAESWSAEYIDEKWLQPLFPHVWRYMEETHGPRQEDEFWWIPLSAFRGALSQFLKKGSITGKDLETIKAGKGKKVENTTLYFGLRFNVPPKVWLRNSWDDPPSDSDFVDSKSKKGKGKAVAKPPSTRQANRKKNTLKDAVIDVDNDSDKDNAPSGSNPSPESKIKGKRAAVTIKLEPELAAIAKTDTLFLGTDSDSEPEFPVSLVPEPAAQAASTGSGGPFGSLSATTPASTGTGTDPVTAAVSLPAAASDTSGTTPSSPTAAALPQSITIPSSNSTLIFGLPSARSSRSSSIYGTSPPYLTSASSIASSSNLSSSHAATHSSARSSALYRSSMSSSVAGPSSPTTSSSSRPFQRDYAAETAELEDFNTYGNFREVTSKRSFDVALLESSGFKSPERPANNPWKRSRRSI
ncbi:hypothetical protein C8F04DRAFT_1239309 [Mycena alexandri]|uniref:Uncharacterized protein n=1 Tax=Mycena alexandri TaxID=1745969 RepID=A0AAD6SDT5_9AGAR|nr:hypothetical protein C8F04DRAFT_1239309 [Mycena alexandri]